MSRRILLTGATGALGPHVAAELLASGATDRLNVLVRADAHHSARHRFDALAKTVKAIFSAAHPALAPNLDRLQPLSGDLRFDNLALDPSTTDTNLHRDTSVILHAAADTRFRNCPEAQWNVNVEGTRRMLDFARRCPRLRQFIFVSTTCVAGSRNGLILETAPSDPPEFLNQYERTKWEAEQLVLASGLPVRIARVSIVMGSEATGFVHHPGALHRVLRWFGRGLIPLVPGSANTTIDLISTETAARCIARALAHDSTGRIWHIAAGHRATPLPELMSFVWNYFATHEPSPRHARHRPPILVDRDRFERFRRAIDPQKNVGISQVMESVESFLPGLLQSQRIFATTNAEHLWDGPLPIADWRQTLAAVLRANCLRRPSKSNTRRGHRAPLRPPFEQTRRIS